MKDPFFYISLIVLLSIFVLCSIRGGYTVNLLKSKALRKELVKNPELKQSIVTTWFFFFLGTTAIALLLILLEFAETSVELLQILDYLPIIFICVLAISILVTLGSVAPLVLIIKSNRRQGSNR